MKYNVVYADPPWPHNTGRAGMVAYDSVRVRYSVMNMKELGDLALPVANDALCFMWALNGFLEPAFGLMRAWGFRPVTVAFVWVKLTSKGNLRNGFGPYSLPGAELCLLGTRGKVKHLTAVSSVKQVVMAPVVKHSRKPDEVRNRIDTLVPEGPRLEMFARRPTPGWDVFGDEVEGSITL